MRRFTTRLAVLLVLVPGLAAQTVFEPPVFLPAASGPIGGNSNAALGDLDGDGDLDAVLGSGFDPLNATMRVFLNDGAGALAESGSFGSFPGPSQLQLVDMDVDGDLDLVLITNGSLTILPGNGDATFGSFAGFSVTNGPTRMDVGDLNGDGHLDVLLSSFEIEIFSIDAKIQTWLGDGQLGFTLHSEFTAPSDVLDLDLVDLDGDGALDACALFTDRVPNIFLGDGTGGFAATPSQVLGLPASRQVVFGDVDGDAHADMLVADAGPTLQVLLGNGDASFTHSQSLAAGTSVPVPALGDFDGDGLNDLGMTYTLAGQGQLELLLGNGDGLFASNLNVSMGGLNTGGALSLGDLDGDGRLDAVANVVGGISTLRNRTYFASEPYTDLGFAFPGTNGYPVQLASGPLLAGTAFEFELLNGLPGGKATMVLGFSGAYLPFKGGTMVPFPNKLIFNNLMDVDGRTSISGVWPAGTPADVPLWLQYWFKDTGAQNNEAGTSAILLVTP